MTTNEDNAVIRALLDEAVVEIEQARALVTDTDEGGTVPPEPTPEGVDLTVEMAEPDPLAVGQPANFRALVTNAGTADVPAGTIVGVGFYLDEDTKEVTWASTDRGLAAGADVELATNNAPWTGGPWVPTAAGEHIVTAFVDDLNRIPEWSETNNEDGHVVTIAEGPPPPEPGSGLFPADSLWNTVKRDLVFADGADGLLRGANYGVNNGPYSHPMTWSTAADPIHHIECPNTWGWPAQTIAVNMRDDATPAAGSDGHLCLLNADGRLVDMWILTPTGHRSWRCSAYAMHNWQTGSGWGQASPFQAAGITACGAPTGAGTITADDVRAGVINHALCMAFDWGSQGGVGTCWTGQLPPAIASDVHGGPGSLAESALLVATGPKPVGLNTMESALYDACATYGAWVVDKLDGAPMFYGDRSPEVGGAFGGGVTAVGRTLRMVKTW
jgi:hypothetical protein